MSFREFKITRSEATNLVEVYMKCTNNCADNTIPITIFRHMTSFDNMGTVLVGKVPSHKDTETSDMFFNTIKELVDLKGKEESYITQKRIINTTMREYCKLYCGEDEHCEFIICPARSALWYLNSAIINYFQQTHKQITEYPGDCVYEDNTCFVCNGINDYFYYSTMHGLNMPVCKICAFAKDDDEEEAEKDEEKVEEEEYAGYVFVYPEYKIEPESCCVCNYNGCGLFYYSSDRMEPVCNTCETNYRNKTDCEKRIYHDKYIDQSSEE